MTKNFRIVFLLVLSVCFYYCSSEEGGKSDGGIDAQMSDNIPPKFDGLSSITLNFPESVKLSWLPAQDNVTAENKIVYLICMSEEGGECLSNFRDRFSVTGVLSYNVTGLVPGKRYFFVVRAKDEEGNVDNNSVEKSVVFEKEKDKTPPTFMGLLFATPSGPKSVRLIWDSATDNNTPKEKIVYSICLSEQKSACINNFKEAYRTEGGVTSYDVGDLTTGKTYYFVVRAIDEDGNMEMNREERSARPSEDDRFAKTYGDATYRSASAFATITDGFLICGGGRVGDMLDSDIFITRLDMFGNVKWIKVYGGLKGDSCSDITVNSDGTFYVVGSTQSFSQLGDKDLLLLKFSATGDLIFAKRLHSDKNDLNPQVALLSDGTVVFTGYTELENGKYDSFIIFFDQNGGVLKKKFIHSDADNYITRVKVFGDKIYLTGYTNPKSGVDYDGFILIMDKDTNIITQKFIGGTDYDNITAMDLSSNNELLLGGQTKSFGDTEGDIFVVMINSISMDKIFSKVYGIDKRKDSIGDLRFVKDSIVIVGDTMPPIGGDVDGILFRSDLSGELLVKRQYRGIRDDWLSRVNICSDSLCVLGGTASMHNETSEVWFLKLKDDGTTGGECVVNFINELNVSTKEIEPVIADGKFEIVDANLSISDVSLDYVEVGSYTDYQCVVE